jgi:Sec-independent protein translocase protein TatA
VTNQWCARNLGVVVLATAFFVGAPETLRAAQVQNPIKSFKDAWKKAKQQAEQEQVQRQAQQQKQNPQAPNQPAANAESPSANNAADAAASGAAVTAAPAWTPPTGDDVAASATPVRLEPMKLPDVIGLHLGMPADQAAIAAHKIYPNAIFEHFPEPWPDAVKPNAGFTVLSRPSGNDLYLYLSFTAPPGPQVLWRVYRRMERLGINHQTLLNDLRAKYGRETFATDYNMIAAAKSDPQIDTLIWLYKEDGERVPMPPPTTFSAGTRSIRECWEGGNGGFADLAPQMPHQKNFSGIYPGWCSGMVALRVEIGAGSIVHIVQIEMIDVPLAIRTADAAHEFLAKVADQKRKEQLEKSKQVKPVL